MTLHTGTALDCLEGDAGEVGAYVRDLPALLRLALVSGKEHPAKGQEIGTEKTPDEFVAKLVEVFAEVWRVLGMTVRAG